MNLVDEGKVVGFSLYDHDGKPVSVTIGTQADSSWLQRQSLRSGLIRRSYSKLESLDKKKREQEERLEQLSTEEPTKLAPRITVGLGLDRTHVEVPVEELDAFVHALHAIQDAVADRKHDREEWQRKLREARNS